MKIVLSFWSKPALAFNEPLARFASGWLRPEWHWYSWLWSAHTAMRSYGRVDLITDDEGKRLLVDELALPVSNVELSLQGIEAHPGLWTYGKLVTYSLQREPFLHIDADVYLWERFPAEILSAPIVVQNFEFGPRYAYDSVYEQPRRDLQGTLKVIPRCWQLYADEQTAACCGVFGGNDVESVNYCATQARQLIEHPDNAAGWSTISNRGIGGVREFNCAIEQLTMYCAAMERATDMMPLFFEDELTDGDARARQLHFTHMMGDKGRPHERAIAALEEKVRRHYPKTFDRIQEMVRQ